MTNNDKSDGKSGDGEVFEMDGVTIEIGSVLRQNGRVDWEMTTNLSDFRAWGTSRTEMLADALRRLAKELRTANSKANIASVLMEHDLVGDDETGPPIGGIVMSDLAPLAGEVRDSIWEAAELLERISKIASGGAFEAPR